MRACLLKKSLIQLRGLNCFLNPGRVVPEINRKEIREIILGNYRIIYRIKKDVLEILTVYHSARLLEKEDISKKRLC